MNLEMQKGVKDFTKSYIMQLIFTDGEANASIY